VNLFMKVIGAIGPWFIILLLLFVLIFFVPNTKVKAKSALIGAFVGTIAFQLANMLFSAVVLKVVNYSIIYGSLAAILIFLIWIYLWWVIIFGAIEIAYVHQYRPDEKERKGLPNPPAEQIACGFDILNELAEHYKKGLGAANVRDLGNHLKIPDRTLYTYLDMLERTGFVLKMDRTGQHYIPAKPINDLQIEHIANALYGSSIHPRDSQSIGDYIATQMFSGGILSVREKSLQELSLHNKSGKE
jgi:membrane protein